MLQHVLPKEKERECTAGIISLLCYDDFGAPVRLWYDGFGAADLEEVSCQLILRNNRSGLAYVYTLGAVHAHAGSLHGCR